MAGSVKALVMPYIPQDRRDLLNAGHQPLVPGHRLPGHDVGLRQSGVSVKSSQLSGALSDTAAGGGGSGARQWRGSASLISAIIS
jgi:hypothetical protein